VKSETKGHGLSRPLACMYICYTA